MLAITGLLMAMGGIGHMEAGGSLLAGALTSGSGCCMMLAQTYNRMRYQ